MCRRLTKLIQNHYSTIYHQQNDVTQQQQEQSTVLLVLPVIVCPLYGQFNSGINVYAVHIYNIHVSELRQKHKTLDALHGISSRFNGAMDDSSNCVLCILLYTHAA